MTIRKNYPFSGTRAHRTHRAAKNRKPNYQLAKPYKLMIRKLEGKEYENVKKEALEKLFDGHDCKSSPEDGCECGKYQLAD